MYTPGMIRHTIEELRNLGYTAEQARFIIRNCGTGAGGFSEGNDCAKGKASKDGDGDGEFEGDKGGGGGKKDGGSGAGARITEMQKSVDSMLGKMKELEKLQDTDPEQWEAEGEQEWLRLDKSVSSLEKSIRDAKREAKREAKQEGGGGKKGEDGGARQEATAKKPKAITARKLRGLQDQLREAERDVRILGDMEETDPKQWAESGQKEWSRAISRAEEVKRTLRDVAREAAVALGGSARGVDEFDDDLIDKLPGTQLDRDMAKAEALDIARAERDMSRRPRRQPRRQRREDAEEGTPAESARELAKIEAELAKAKADREKLTKSGKPRKRRSFSHRLMELRKAGLPISVAIRMSREDGDD